MGFLTFVSMIFRFVFVIRMGFWALVTAPLRSPRPLVMILAVTSGVALAGGLVTVAINVFSPNSTPDPGLAEMGVFVERLEPIVVAFTQGQDEYNAIARRLDGEVRSENSQVRLAMLYTEWVQAARTRRVQVESQTESLKQIGVPPSLQSYHQLQIELFELTARFLAELQRAYDVSLSTAEQASAYARAGTLNRQVIEMQDQMLAELNALGLVP